MKYLNIPVQQFETKLGYIFSNKDLLEDAITHPSYLPMQSVAVFERLEFLGDKVLGMIVAELLLELFPLEDEGEISNRFTNLTNRNALNTILDKIGIIDAITLMNDCKTPSVYADICEAIIGAIFLDSNYYTIKKLIYCWTDCHGSNVKNPKTVLQEFLQQKFAELPIYSLIEQRNNEFVMSVQSKRLNISATGRGYNKQLAAISAAENLIALLADKFNILK